MHEQVEIKIDFWSLAHWRLESLSEIRDQRSQVKPLAERPCNKRLN